MMKERAKKEMYFAEIVEEAMLLWSKIINYMSSHSYCLNTKTNVHKEDV